MRRCTENAEGSARFPLSSTLEVGLERGRVGILGLDGSHAGPEANGVELPAVDAHTRPASSCVYTVVSPTVGQRREVLLPDDAPARRLGVGVQVEDDVVLEGEDGGIEVDEVLLGVGRLRGDELAQGARVEAEVGADELVERDGADLGDVVDVLQPPAADHTWNCDSPQSLNW